MKKLTKVLCALLLVGVASFGLTACGGDKDKDKDTGGGTNPITTNWFAPMFSVNMENKSGTVFGGDLVLNDNSSILTVEDGVSSVARNLTATTTPAQPIAALRGKVMTEDVTGADLVAGGATKGTLNLAYEGDKTFEMRITATVARTDGHNFPVFLNDRLEGVVILWEDKDGDFWNMRRNGIGGQFTGGTLHDGTHPVSEGFPTEANFTYWCISLNKSNAADFATQDFYVVGLETGSYVITFNIERPAIGRDASGTHNGHFHAWETVVSTSFVYSVSAPAVG